VPNYSIRQLEYFVAVAESGSIVEAARRLHVTQPTVSGALSKMEAQFGTGLFIRHHARGVSLSASGRRLLPEARTLLRHLEEFEHEARAASGEVVGRLDVGCFVTLAPRYMPELISRFTTSHPRVEIAVQEGFQEDLVQGLTTGRFDLALLYDENLPAELDAAMLAEMEPYVLLPKGHRLASARHIALESLRDEPFILFDVSPSREFFTGVLRAAGVEPNVAFASPSFEMVRGLVGQGRGYSLLVTRPHGDHTYDGEAVVARPIRDRVRPGRICLARLRATRPTRLAEAFGTCCRELIAASLDHAQARSGSRTKKRAAPGAASVTRGVVKG
jgi:DNA-binding transcriptional LysR family regulator